MDFYKLNERYLETKQYKDRWLALYQELYFLVIPDRDAFNIKFNYIDTGKPVMNQIYDTTAVIASYQRANDIHGLLTPKDRSWGKYELDRHKYPQDFIDGNADLMDEINDNIMFYINESNLAGAVSSSNLDLVGGTGAIWVESHDDDTPLFFRSIPSVALYVEYSTNDTLDTGWYQAKMSGREIVSTFPDYKGTQYSTIRTHPDTLYTLVYGQIKQDNRYYIYAVMEADPFTPLWERDSSYKQLLIFRDRVRPGESEGRGIGLDMLPTIRDLNKVVQYDRQSLALKAYPPMFVDTNSYFNAYSIRQWAGTNIPRTPGAKKNPIEAMQMPDHPVVSDRILELQTQINRAFMVEPLGEITDSVKSATEVSIRENRAQRTASVDISRLINEQPKQIFQVAAMILGERRLLTRDRRVQGINIGKMKFTFESPLYDLQKQDDLSHFITNMQTKQQFMGEEFAMATLDLPETNKFLTNVLNLKHKLFKNDEDLKKALGQMAQAQQDSEAAQNPPRPTTGALPVPAQNPSQVNI